MSSLSILFIDDEPVLRQVACELLKSLGLEVIVAADGAEALSVIPSIEARLVGIVSDLSMPNLDGLELRSKLLNDFKHIPFIVLSGNITRELALRAVELKIAAFIDKPFEKATLLETVQREIKDRVAQIKDEQELLMGFVQEAKALVDEMESLCIAAEEHGGDSEVVNRVFACAHTIKGASGYFKPVYVNRFSHAFEDYLSKMKAVGFLSSEGTTVCLKAIDHLRKLLSQLEDGSSITHEMDQLTSIFKSDENHVLGDAGPQKIVMEAPAKIADLRVSLSMLDSFLERSGEMTVLRNMVNKTMRRVERHHSPSPELQVLTELLAELSKATTDMQERISDLRKVPLRQLAKPLQRTVRDLANVLKKKIHLEFSGQELRIDHQLGEGLSRCLIHMIRNAADHGLEGAEERERMGKPLHGTIRIMAENSRENIRLVVSDDGRGIDEQKVMKKAIDKGLITEADAAGYSAERARMLILLPGFSTSEAVTDVSGRGVGMDMVKTTIESMGGTVTIESVAGQGTTFVLSLPIPKSVLIISSLLVSCRKRLLALPQDSIERIIALDSVRLGGKVRFIKHEPYICEDGVLMPIIDLGRILDSREARITFEAGMLIMVRSKFGRYCIHVDEVHDIEDTVVKQVGRWMDMLPIYLGATFLGEGQVGLILSVDGIAEKNGFAHTIVESEPAQLITSRPSQEMKSQLVLLIEGAGGQTYAINEHELFRLEEVDISSIQHSGESKVLIYRDKVMPIHTLESCLKVSGGDTFARRQKLPLIVTRQREGYFAIAVERIGDLVLFQDDQLESAAEHGSAKIIRGKTVIMLQIKDLIRDAAVAI